MELENNRKRRQANSGLVVDIDRQLDEDASSSNAPQDFESLRRSISPPARRKRQITQTSIGKEQYNNVAVSSFSPSSCSKKPISSFTVKTIPSPVQLSTINELPASSNIDTVSLKDVLGDPLIKECWLFNYLFDVDYIM